MSYMSEIRKPFVNNLKTPLQAILIVEDLIDGTASGEKIQTIREGWRDYKPGKVVVACPEMAWCCIKEIVEVKHTTVDQMGDNDYKDEGWLDRAEMVEDLKRFYPDMNNESAITVIKWK